MSKILTPQEAKLAWARGQELQFRTVCGRWSNLSGLTTLMSFDVLELRLKPQEVHIDVRIPKPFVPEMGEKYFRVGTTSVLEFSRIHLDDSKYTVGLGCYRTLEEAQLVFDTLVKAIHGDTNEVASQ